MLYQSFILRFEHGEAGSFSFSVESPAGEAAGRCDLTRFLGLVPRLGSGGSLSPERHLRPPAGAATGPSPEQIGCELFDAVFQGEVRDRWRACLGTLRSRQQGLRLQIELDPRRQDLARLLDVPWELLADPADRRPIALGHQTPIVRYLALPRPPGSVALPRPLRILALAALSPQPPLDLARERQNLEKACGPLKNVVLEWVEPATLEQLRRRLLEREFHVLCFMGHGRFDTASGEGMLYLGSDGAPPTAVSARVFAETLDGFPSLRLVVLNACQTAQADPRHGGEPFEGVASALMLGGIPAAVAMQAPVADAAAIAFSKALFERLTAGAPLEAAVTEGRLAIRQLGERCFEWAVPTLFLRARDGTLFVPERRRRLIAALVLGLVLATGAVWGLWRERQLSALIDEAAVLVQQGARLPAAREKLETVLRRTPDHAPAHALLAALEENEARYAEALLHLETATRLQPGHAPYPYQLGYLLNTLGRHEEARTHLLRALELDPGYAEAANELGNAERELGRLPEARAAYTEALRLAQARPAEAQELAPIWKNLGRAALEAGEPAAALEPLRQALASYDPENAQTRQGFAEASELLAAASAAASAAGIESRDRGGASRELTPLVAVITWVDGAVLVTTPASSGEAVHRAKPMQRVVAGAEIVVLAGGGLALVCPDDHHVELRAAQRWVLSPEACAGGELLPAGAYRWLVPRGGRLRVVEGLLELEPTTRPAVEPNALAPLVLSPRNTRLREARPRLEWTQTPGATEYEIAIVGLGVSRLSAKAVECRPAPAWGEGLEICTAPFPERFADLEPERVYFLDIGARRSIVSPLYTEQESVWLERCSVTESAQIETALAVIDAATWSESAHLRLRAGLLADRKLYAEAIDSYRRLLAAESSGEVLVTLGDLYLVTGLDGLAQRSYKQMLGKGDDAIEAAARLGLGLVETGQGQLERARESFRRAVEIYRRAGLEPEGETAKKLLEEAQEEMPRSRE